MEQTQSDQTIGFDQLVDDDGVKMTDELKTALDMVERRIQEFIEQNPGQVPDKVFTVNIGIQIAAEGLYSRRVVWEVEAKMPKLTTKHMQLARSKDGKIIAKRPGGQQRIPAEILAEAGEKPDDDEDVHHLPQAANGQ